jgi:hypothetical protein
MAKDEWRPIETAPEDIVVMTKIDDEHGERNIHPRPRGAGGRGWVTIR